MKTKLLRKVRKKFAIEKDEKGEYNLINKKTNAIVLPWGIKPEERLMYGVLIAKAIRLTIGAFQYEDLKRDAAWRRWHRKKGNF